MRGRCAERENARPPAVAALCGLRASALRGLRWSDVDLKAEEQWPQLGSSVYPDVTRQAYARRSADLEIHRQLAADRATSP
jgi:integrase